MIEQQTVTRESFVTDYLAAIQHCLAALDVDEVTRFLSYLEQAYAEDRQVFIIGNGGSAATASHMACDLGKNLYPPASAGSVRRLRVSSLTDNVSLLTALANDCGYDQVFSQQLAIALQPGDLVVAISASGNSPNVLEALAFARARGARTAGLLGFDGGRARDLVDVAVIIGSRDYGHVEDLHLMLNHVVAAWLRQAIHRTER
jgi:D-sedoheptulose 7-phosphate isomerase